MVHTDAEAAARRYEIANGHNQDRYFIVWQWPATNIHYHCITCDFDLCKYEMGNANATYNVMEKLKDIS